MLCSTKLYSNKNATLTPDNLDYIYTYIYIYIYIFAKLILLNNYSTILAEPEVNNCFSIFT